MEILAMGTYGIRSALTFQGSDDSPEEVQEVGDMDDVDDVMLVDGSEIGRENHLGCFKNRANTGRNCQPQLVSRICSTNSISLWFRNSAKPPKDLENLRGPPPIAPLPGSLAGVPY